MPFGFVEVGGGGFVEEAGFASFAELLGGFGPACSRGAGGFYQDAGFGGAEVDFGLRGRRAL